MRRVEQSILAPAIVEARVIYNGLDLAVFRPGDQERARTELGIPLDVNVLLFVGFATRSNIWKDYPTMESAVRRVADRLRGKRLLLICLGEKGEQEHLGDVKIWFMGYQNDDETVARYYQAADVYVHAARADTFPNTVIEALSCGTPVVATAVGGIPEQIEDGVTGFLVDRGDAAQMATRIEQLLSDNDLRMRMGTQAFEDARRRFDLNRQAEEYLEWYYRILANWQCKEGERPVS
jgi:glycosyltransferase involved in cell wall biosynthesis